MFTPKYYYIPLRLGTQTDFEPQIPAEFESYFTIAEKVGRYVFTEEEVNFMFQDNVAVHTKRLVNYLRNLTLPDFLDKDIIERMLWMHDLPEAVVNEDRGSDYVTHEKNADEVLGDLQDSLEEIAAKEMFSAHDFELFHQTEVAKKKIKKAEWSDLDTYKNSIFAKMLDWIDSRNKFTYVTTEWIAHPDYLAHPVLPPYATMRLCLMESYQVWMRDFAKISDIQIRDFMLGFIHDEIYEFHRLRWDAVIEKTPIEIQAMYQEFVAFGKTR
jgi:hypothetical protein